MLSKRDLTVCAISILATMTVFGLARTPQKVMGSSVFDWNKIPARKSEVGDVRQFFKTPTATLDQLECHVTTLDPGRTSHPPHRHPDEELLIVKEGTVESLVNGEWQRLGPGSVIFQASNEMHSIRNAGQGIASYHVIRWISPGKLEKKN